MKTAFRIALPVMVGYFPVAVTFGMVAQQQGVSIAMTTALSVLVYAGAAQFIGLTLLAAGVTSFFPVFITIWLVNIRHFVLSFAYLPNTRGWKLGSKMRFFPLLTDEAFAVLVSSDKMKTSAAVSFRTAMLCYLTWIAGSIVGFYSGTLVPDPKKLGLDFALSALFVGIITLFLKKTSHVVTLISTFALSTLFYAVFDGGKSSVLLAALIGSFSGWWIDDRAMLKDAAK